MVAKTKRGRPSVDTFAEPIAGEYPRANDEQVIVPTVVTQGPGTVLNREVLSR